MQIAQRLTRIPPYLFMELRKKIAKAKADGIDVISLAIGDPVEPTPESIIKELCRTAYDPENHRYPTDEEKGMFAFREEVSRWYKERYGVTLDPANEVLGLIGSKEGCHHFILARVNPGDIVLMTDPGYPAYRASILMGGGEPYSMPILPETGYLPIFEDIPADVVKKATAMFLNYPNNPTGACANRDFFRRAVDFAKKNDIAICYDNPYSEVVFDGQERLSILSVEGAKEVAVELNSLSKPYNMTGWRIGMAVGNAQMIAALGSLKSNLDSGIPQAIQYAAIEALSGPQDAIDQHNAIYQRRRDLIMEVLEDIGLEVRPMQAGLYVWAKVPKGYTSVEFANDLLEKVGVVVIPGIGYGKSGEGYVRLSLTISDAALVKGLSRLGAWQDTKNRFKSKH